MIITADMKELINGLSNPAQYLHCIIDIICGGDGKLDVFFKDDIAASTLAPSFQSCIENLSAVESENLPSQLSEAGISSNVTKIMCDAIKARITEIKGALVKKNCAISYAFLSDFDWSIRITMGSDKLSLIKDRVIIITFLIKKPDGAKEEIVVEMNKEDLDNFLASCSAINSVLQTIPS